LSCNFNNFNKFGNFSKAQGLDSLRMKRVHWNK